MRDLKKGQRLDLLAAVAKHGGESWIGFENAPVQPDNGDADRRILASDALRSAGTLPTASMATPAANSPAGATAAKREPS